MSRRIGAGAVLGGWVSWILAVIAMVASLPSFVFYGLLFFTASVIGIVAMRRGRVGHGVALVLLSLLAPVFALVSNIGHYRWGDWFSSAPTVSQPYVPAASPPPIVAAPAPEPQAQTPVEGAAPVASAPSDQQPDP